jgi:8-oxo-dGTP pyrophosphatase MutT (NUDIX family)
MSKAIDIIKLIEASPHTVYANNSGAEFWGNIGAGVLAIAESTGRILVSYRSKFVNEPNTWGVVGGKLDDDKGSVQKAALREFKEETGYSGPLKLVPAFVFKTKGFTYHNFIGLVKDEFASKLDWETERFEWMTFEEVKNLKPMHFGLKVLLKDGKSTKLIQKWSKK